MVDDNVFRYNVSRERITTQSPSKQTLWLEAQAAAEKYASEAGFGLCSATCEWSEDEGLVFKYRLVSLPNLQRPVVVSHAHGPDIPEVPPVNNNYPAVWSVVIEDTEKLIPASEIRTLVVEDMKKRDEFGFNKYKTRLHPFDGRDTDWDIYQELLDLVVYTRKKIYEKEMEKKIEGVK